MSLVGRAVLAPEVQIEAGDVGARLGRRLAGEGGPTVGRAERKGASLGGGGPPASACWAWACAFSSLHTSQNSRSCGGSSVRRGRGPAFVPALLAEPGRVFGSLRLPPTGHASSASDQPSSSSHGRRRQRPGRRPALRAHAAESRSPNRGRSRSPGRPRSRGRSRSPNRGRSRSPNRGRSRSRSRSPAAALTRTGTTGTKTGREQGGGRRLDDGKRRHVVQLRERPGEQRRHQAFTVDRANQPSRQRTPFVSGSPSSARRSSRMRSPSRCARISDSDGSARSSGFIL